MLIPALIGIIIGAALSFLFLLIGINIGEARKHPTEDSTKEEST